MYICVYRPNALPISRSKRPTEMLAPNLYSIKKYKERKFGKIGNVCLKRLVRCLFYVLFFGALLNLAGKYLRPKVKRAEPKAHRLCNAIRMVDGRILGWGDVLWGMGMGIFSGCPSHLIAPAPKCQRPCDRVDQSGKSKEK